MESSYSWYPEKKLPGCPILQQLMLEIPSGKHTNIAIEHGPVEMVDLPIEHGVFS